MLHLFHNTYIELDAHINLNQDRIVISNEHGYDLLTALVAVSAGELLAYGNSITDVLAHFNYKSLTALLDMCADRNIANPDVKIIIYCDNEAYYGVLSCWHKTIFKNIDSDSSFNILVTNLSMQANPGIPSRSPNPDRYRLAIPTKEAYSIVFNDTNVDVTEHTPLFEKCIDSLNVEYLISSYLYDGSYKEQLKPKMIFFLKKFVLNWIQGTSDMLLGPKILDSRFRRALGITGGTIDDPLSSWDNQLASDALKKTTVQRTLDLSILTEEEKADLGADLNKFTYLFTVGWQRAIVAGFKFEPGYRFKGRWEKCNFYYSLLAKNSDDISDEDLSKIFEMDSSSFYLTYSMSSWKGNYSINTWMIEYFYDALRENKKELLLPYILR
jgi:hypothetical protein